MTPTHRSDPMTDKLRKTTAPPTPAEPAGDALREALVEVINAAMDGRELVDGEPWGAEIIADRLLARGLRLPGRDEAMAWGIVRPDGIIIAGGFKGKDHAQRFSGHGERVVRVAIRVVEGGDDE